MSCIRVHPLVPVTANELQLVTGCRSVLGGGGGCITYPASQLQGRGQRSETPPGVSTGLWHCGGTWVGNQQYPLHSVWNTF